MARFSVNLPTLILTSSATDTSTQTNTAWQDIDDAESLTLTLLTSAGGASTAPGIQVQVAYTTLTTATFYPLLYQSSGASVIYLNTSAGGGEKAVPIWPVGFKQLRIGTSNVTGAGYTLTGIKQFEV